VSNFLDLRLISGRIKSRLGGAVEVGTAADLSAAKSSGSPRTPSAYVCDASTASQPHKAGSGGVMQQRSKSRFAVTICVRNYRMSELGSQGNDELKSFAESIGAALLNWVPAQGCGAVEHVSGALLEYNQSELWWEDTYQFSSARTSAPNP
jgi:hypothetical protein